LIEHLARRSSSSGAYSKHSHLPQECLAQQRRAVNASLVSISMEPKSIQTETTHELADDLLRGADAISEFIFGRKQKNGKRKVYYLAETSRLPVFRIGSVLCARRSVLLDWISGQESKVRPSRG
jgi:hypothetical protein